MHGVKVYLKSGRDKLYKVLVLLAGCLLAIAGYIEFSKPSGSWLVALVYGSLALALVAYSLLPPKTQKGLRYLPSLGLIGGAAVVMWQFANGQPLLKSLDLPFAIFLGALSFAGPLVVGTRFAYFSPRRIRLRYSVLKTEEFSWKDVSDVQLEDDFLEIGLSNGKDIRLVPSYQYTQHLRSYLNEIARKAQSDKREKAPRETVSQF